MAWNIFHGGRGVTETVDAVGPENLELLAELMASVDADVYLVIETYGSGHLIEQRLNASTAAPPDRPYRGYRITQRPDGKDNLWIFTRLEVIETLPAPAEGGSISDFHLGGLRVRWDDQVVPIVVTWINFTEPWVADLIDQNAADRQEGKSPRHDIATVLEAEQRQTAQLREIVDVHLPVLLGGALDPSQPMILGGDLNTVPGSDWTSPWRDATGHHGAEYPLTATDVLASAGFIDAYRAVHPDVSDWPGSTWSPLPTEPITVPARIDLIMSTGFTAISADVVQTRHSSQPPGLFLSDHAGLVVELELGSHQ